jgi:hypothetical protein
MNRQPFGQNDTSGCRVKISSWPRSLLLGVNIKLLALSRTGTYDFLSEPRMGGSEKNRMFEE